MSDARRRGPDRLQRSTSNNSNSNSNSNSNMCALTPSLTHKPDVEAAAAVALVLPAQLVAIDLPVAYERSTWQYRYFSLHYYHS